jgi:hypothetical protein
MTKTIGGLRDPATIPPPRRWDKSWCQKEEYINPAQAAEYAEQEFFRRLYRGAKKNSNVRPGRR